MRLSRAEQAMSLRSIVTVAGSTTSACRAVAVQKLSCTTTSRGRRHARSRRFRSWWWWKGLPPAQYTSPMCG